MVVDWLGNSLAVFQVFDLLIHEIKVLCLGVERCYALPLPASSIKTVVVIQADDCGHV